MRLKSRLYDLTNHFFYPLVALLVVGVTPGFNPVVAEPVADIHLHYKWNQQEVTSVEQAVAALEQNNIALAGVIGTPPELAQLIRQAAPGKIFAWYSPYSKPGDWNRWYRDQQLVSRAESAIVSGDYIGVGELHLIGGFAPSWDSPVIDGLLGLSSKFQAPLLIHVEFGRADYLIGMCQHQPKARLLLAHAGAPLRPTEVRRALESCDNLWWELSARDPFRYGGSLIVDEANGQLKPEWKQLIVDYADRLMLGSDPVWPVDQLDRWDEPDSGWEHIGRFWDAHEHWLGQLPAPVARKIRYTNAANYFGFPTQQRHNEPSLDKNG